MGFTLEQNKNTCSKKRKHTPASAKEYIEYKGLSGWFLRAYECLSCGKLHTTSDKEKVEAARREKANI